MEPEPIHIMYRINKNGLWLPTIKLRTRVINTTSEKVVKEYLTNNHPGSEIEIISIGGMDKPFPRRPKRKKHIDQSLNILWSK